MADLAALREPSTLRDLWRRIEALEAAAKFLRTSRATIARAEFPAGVIPPAALEHATSEPGVVNLTTTNFGLSSTSVDLLAANVPTPDGFTSCVVSLTGRVYGVNTTAGVSYLSAQVRIAGTTGNAVPVNADAAGGAGDAVLNTATLAVVLSGLTAGSSFSIALSAWTDAATWTADPSALADLTGSIVWFA